MSLVNAVTEGANISNRIIVGVIQSPTGPFVQIVDLLTLQNVPWFNPINEVKGELKTNRGEVIAEYDLTRTWYDVEGNMKSEGREGSLNGRWAALIRTPATLLIIIIGVIFAIFLPIYLAFVGLAVTHIIYNYIRYPAFRQENGPFMIFIDIVLAPLYIFDVAIRKIFWRYY
jgi:hypothetical protein